MFINTLLSSNINALQQAAALVDRLDNAQYGEQTSDISVSTVGGHVRHLVEHYERFFEGLSDGLAEGLDGDVIVDYEKRLRDPILETQRIEALQRLDQAVTTLRALQEKPLRAEQAINIRLQVTADAMSTPLVSSTLGRELIFLHGHTTHHFAQIALQLRALRIPIAHDFGIAPSTQEYLQRSDDLPNSTAA